MIFKKIIDPLLNPFIKPQWQAKNPQTRIKGIQELLEPGSPELATIAQNDSEDKVRVCAINRLSDLDVLQTIIMSKVSEEVINAAYHQYNQMLAGEKFPIPALETREKIIKGCRNSRSLEYLALHAKETELRKIAVKKIVRDALLGDIALNDKNADIRFLAAQQIGKKSTLERVGKISRNKDKRVFKVIKDKLTTIIEDEQRPKLLSQEVVDTVDKLEKLYKRNRLLIERPTFNNLVARWQEIKNYANEELVKRYQDISLTIQEKIAQLEAEQQKQQAVIENLNNIIANLTAEANDLLKERELNNLAQVEEKQKIIELYKQSWQEQIGDIDKSNQNQLNARYQDILKLIEQSEDHEEQAFGSEKAEGYLKQLEGLSKDKHHLGEKLVNTLFSKFEKELHSFEPHAKELKELSTRYHTVSELLKNKLTTQKQAQEEINQFLQQQLSTIAEKLESGLTDEAMRLKSIYIQKVEKNQALSNTEKRHFLDKIKDPGNQLNQLTSWKNWANNRERENLCLKAEEIYSSIENSNSDIKHLYNEYSDQIKLLRSQWKKLSGRSPDELWNRFNNACNQTFEKFQPYFDQQAELRQNNLEQKQKIVDQLKSYVEYMNWPLAKEAGTAQELDWKQVQSILNQAKKEWASIKQVDRKAYKPIAKEFDKYTGMIEVELKKTWNQNQVLYIQLIDKVYALQEILDEDLNSAISQAKALQNDWKQIGPVQHFQRKKLWRKFRKGCDIIFAKRDQQNNQKQKENELILLEKTGLCENLEALNQQQLPIHDFNNAYEDIYKLWLELKPKAKQISSEVNKRFYAAVKNFEKKRQQLEVLKEQQQLQLLKQKALLCAELEDNSTEVNELESFQQRWDELEKLSDSQQEYDIQGRFQQALQIINDIELKERLMEESHNVKESLCLRLELITGNQSPEENSQSRMELQVQRLNSAINDKEDFRDDDINRLQTLWLMQPRFPEHDSLEKRFFAIIEED